MPRVYSLSPNCMSSDAITGDVDEPEPDQTPIMVRQDIGSRSIELYQFAPKLWRGCKCLHYRNSQLTWGEP